MHKSNPFDNDQRPLAVQIRRSVAYDAITRGLLYSAYSAPVLVGFMLLIAWGAR